MENYLTISEIKNISESQSVMLKAMVKRIEESKTQKGGMMFTVSVEDKTGKLDFKIWDNLAIYARMAQDCIGKIPCEFEIEIKVTSENKIFYNAKFARPLDDEKLEDYDSDFTPSAETLEKTLDLYLESIKNKRPDLYAVCDKIIGKENGFKKEEYRNMPAGISMHHANKRGLMYHSCSMLQMADGLMRAIDGFTPLKYDTSLVYTAIILHDVFKTEEYMIENEQTKVTKMSILGHSLLACEYVHDCFRDGLIDEMTEFKLKHIIASHHGELEYGAISVPVTREAILVHYIDELNAKDNALVNELLQLEPDTLASQKNFCIGGNAYRGE